MLQPVVRTKWHKLRPLLDKDQVYFTAPIGGRAEHATAFGYRPEMVSLLLDVGDQLPKFVIDSELIKLANKDDYIASLMDMKKAGVLRLPFPAMIVEFGGRGHHSCVIIRDLAYAQLFPWEGPEIFEHDRLGISKDSLGFYGYPMRYEKDQDGEYLVIPPSMQFLGLQDKDGTPHLAISAACANIISTTGPKLDAIIQETYKKDAAESWLAIFAALLLMRTVGVERQTIDVGRLNKKRVLSNKPPIPKHIYIHIGKIYRRAKTGDDMVGENYIPRQSPRPHWRRGHNRIVHFGPGKTQIKLKYIDPMLVAYDDESMTVMPEYVVKN